MHAISIKEKYRKVHVRAMARHTNDSADKQRRIRNEWMCGGR